MGLPVAMPSECDASSIPVRGCFHYIKAVAGDHGLNRGGDMIVMALQGACGPASGGAAVDKAAKNVQLRCRFPDG
jgi:hypothetical protein